MHIDQINSEIVKHGDGIHFFVAIWSGKARDYVIEPTTRYESVTAADLAGVRVMGSRMIRVTVDGGRITTKRGLT